MTENDFTNRLQSLRKGRTWQELFIWCKCEKKKSIYCQTGNTQHGFKAYGTRGVILTGD